MNNTRQYGQIAGFNEMYASKGSATTNTAYLVGLTARILRCAVTWDPNGQTTDIVGRNPRDERAYDAWCRNVLIGVRSALALLGLPGGFTISFDHKPPSHARPDLAIVAACLVASGHDLGDVSRTLYLGGFGYAGDRVLPVRGVLPILESVEGFTRAFVPVHNAIEAGANTNRIVCTTIANVHDLIDPSSHTRGFAPRSMDLWSPYIDAPTYTRGLSNGTIESLMHAMASKKNVLIVGANPFSVARAFHEMLPCLSGSEARAIACVHSAVGLLTDGKIPSTRPFRAPHHSVADRGLVGGDWPARPGEVSLANYGTLVLDHVLDFKRSGLDYLAGVVRDRRVKIVRRNETVEYPANTRIVATVYPDELRFLTPDRVAFLGEFVRVDV